MLYKQFKPAFLGRMKVVPYYPISDEVLEKIIHLKLDRIAKRVAANHQARFDFDAKLVDAVLARCTEVDSGARNVDHILTGTLLPEIAEQVLGRMAEGSADRAHQGQRRQERRFSLQRVMRPTNQGPAPRPQPRQCRHVR